MLGMLNFKKSVCNLQPIHMLAGRLPLVSDLMCIKFFVAVTSSSLSKFALFEAGKKHYDAHHGLYAAKLEVIVLVNPPYKALMWSNLHDGGEADIMVHRLDDAAITYTDWLEMTLAEEMHVYGVRDRRSQYWALVLDSRYMGHVSIIYLWVVLEKPSTEHTFSLTTAMV
eukprot:m51a1_g12044 hypothetical protein (169) ;mRNA; r:1846-5255